MYPYIYEAVSPQGEYTGPERHTYTYRKRSRTGNINLLCVRSREDENRDKETPLEEVEKLEHEDEIRVHHLHGECLRVRTRELAND